MEIKKTVCFFKSERSFFLAFKREILYNIRSGCKNEKKCKREKSMITLNDYLYSGDTVMRILKKYRKDLAVDAAVTGNAIDEIHCDFLQSLIDLLEHNEFLTAQSQKIREFYMYMAKEYPELAFTFKGRIKSLIRAEKKFNGYIVKDSYKYYMTHGTFPPVEELRKRLIKFRDLIAYRIVISLPRCQVRPGVDQAEEELRILYQIANVLPGFLSERGFQVQPTGGVKRSGSPLLEEKNKDYYRDYIFNKNMSEYQSLHITFFDESANCYMEVQLRTKEMDDVAEIGIANHMAYEKRQERERARRHQIPKGECIWFDEAYERGRLLQQLDLSEVDVNMFGAANNSLINDGCGLFRGRQILPYEHLSRFQSEQADD